MISRSSIENIMLSARIEEVVGEFVMLKKRGVNLLGLCPFHDEKTPSFTVSPAKGIYKCFGCGKSGNAVGFVMEHEHYSYPEALRYLAGKYNIEIEEDHTSRETDLGEQKEKESLLILMTYAQQRYVKHLTEHPEGLAIGLTYFRERGFTDNTIKKFGLGYALDEWDDLTRHALNDGFKLEFLEKTGLTIIKEDKKYDRFRGRVIFPICNLSGRAIAFGARILKADPKSPKYVNSPETDIYHKSRILYGIDLAKKEITRQDECFLVEGYTDVISLHQAGVENVVASSGTSLTVEQIRLIGRFTVNITLLYDGDAAGIKASLRGVDLILQEGLNVRVVLFPDGDDPDSFSRKVSTTELKEYIRNNSQDFIRFKTSLLLNEVAGDPVKKAGLIRQIVESISKIPDGITRSTYLQQCAQMLDINEQVLIFELNKLRRKALAKNEADTPVADFPVELPLTEQPQLKESNMFYQEQELIRLLLLFADETIIFESDKEGEPPLNITLKGFVRNELEMDGIRFENELFAAIFAAYDDSQQDQKTNIKYFMEQENEELRNLVGELTSDKYQMSVQWSEKGISSVRKDDNLKRLAMDTIYMIKGRCINQMIRQNNLDIKHLYEANEDYEALQQRNMELHVIKKKIFNEHFGTTIIF